MHPPLLECRIMKNYYVYILTNKPRGIFYVGVTNQLQCRLIEHKLGKIPGFTAKYHLKTLVYVEQYQYVSDAIRREKSLKRLHRAWKIKVIEESNPAWSDLYERFFGSFYENILLPLLALDKKNEIPE